MQVIRLGAICAATFAMVLGASPMLAQSVAQVGGPAEQPPAGFTGQQYVDSRGCVFMRAGLGGKVNWVARIGRDRKAICNEVTPAQAAARLAAGDTPASAGGLSANSVGLGAAPAKSVGAPMKTIASSMTPQKSTGYVAPIAVPGLGGQVGSRTVQAPRVAPKAALQLAAPRYSAGSGACPAEAPVLQSLPLASGGSVSVCTRGDGTANGWRSPSVGTIGGAIQQGGAGRHGAAAQIGAGSYGGASGYSAGSGIFSGGGGYRQTGSGGYVQTVIAGQQIIAPRREVGQYAAAWKDDRLNPKRGLGTQQGWAQQAQIWTNKVPAKTHADVARTKARKPALFGGAARVSTSTMSGGQQVAASAGGRIYVQVGTFGLSANAQNAAGRLAGMGLPVASAKSTRGGQQLVAIMAGPFGSAQQAQQALGMARSAGFGDAYIR